MLKRISSNACGWRRRLQLERAERAYRTEAPVFGHKAPSFSPPDPVTDAMVKARALHPNVFRLIKSYREKGHLVSMISPLVEQKESLAELEAEFYQLELGRRGDELAGPELKHLSYLPLHPSSSVKHLLGALRKAYCAHLTADLSYLSTFKREWMARELESTVDEVHKAKDTQEIDEAHQAFDDSARKHISKLLIHSEVWDLFLGTKFPTLKRYGLEGAEGQLAFFNELLSVGQREDYSWNSIVLAMTHRGRLNLLTGLFNVPPALIFQKIRGEPEIRTSVEFWCGDVVSHMTCSTMVGRVKVNMMPNPSHLEVANPMSMGNTRARQMRHQAGDYAHSADPSPKTIVNVQVHGDAAFIGQGVNQEMLSFSRVPHFSVGGTIHLIVNNQLGFTTPQERGRSSRYSSDLAKMIEAPVLHVNGDHPESLMRAARIAAKYHHQVGEDVVVEMHCYRRRGHNELDDPTITNPSLYRTISPHPTLPQLYAQSLIQQNVMLQSEVISWQKDYAAYLNSQLQLTVPPPIASFEGAWAGMRPAKNTVSTWKTGANIDCLRYLGLQSVSVPEGFSLHSHLQKTHVAPRRTAMMDCGAIDWSTAETLAIGCLLNHGHNVRLSGQDVGRGTFSHRHVMLVDQVTGAIHIPLNSMASSASASSPPHGHLEVANSILSEEAVLAYEYGVSIENPRTLVIWEAQFGDFSNAAQVVIDTMVASGEAKWARSSSLTILLPHGYDGAGPEHSSCRIERFLQLTNSSSWSSDSDAINMSVAWPSTPAQYFHLLCRQQLRDFRTPLIIVTPKTLLRLSAAKSPLEDLCGDTEFEAVLCEDNPTAERVVFCSGKHYYTLQHADPAKPSHVALVRLESLVPFPVQALHNAVDRYPKARDFVWSQEEPRNMGAWSWLAPRFEALIGVRLKYAGRSELAAPAHGLPQLHRQSLHQLISETFG